MVLWDITAKRNLLNKIEIKRYSLPSLWGILILVQLLLILWQYYNLLITASSEDFQLNFQVTIHLEINKMKNFLNV